MGTFELFGFTSEGSLVLVIFFVWVLLLTGFLVFIFWKIRKLVLGVNKGNLVEVINELIKKEDINSESLGDLKKVISEIKKNGVFHVQKIGLTKYNPFKEVGGDHSFSLTILDGKEDGFILTGLHTRDRTRVYLKDVTKGKAKVELSEEEQKSLKIAQK